MYSLPKYMRHCLLKEGLPAVLIKDELLNDLCFSVILTAEDRMKRGLARGTAIAEATMTIEHFGRAVGDIAFAASPKDNMLFTPIMERHGLILKSGQGACYMMSRPA
jgi:hypothetical protein